MPSRIVMRFIWMLAIGCYNTLMSKPTKKKQSSRLSRGRPLIIWANLHRVKVALIVVVIAVLAWGVVAYTNHQRQIAHQRKQFEQTKVELDKLYKDIVVKVGEPAEHKAVQSCEYTNSEFSPGFLYCNIDEYLIYPNTAELPKKVHAALKDQTKTVLGLSPMDQDVFLENPSYEHVVTYSFRNQHQMKCSAAIWKINGALPYESFRFMPTLRSGAYINLNCSAASVKEFYNLSTTPTGQRLY